MSPSIHSSLCLHAGKRVAQESQAQPPPESLFSFRGCWKGFEPPVRLPVSRFPQPPKPAGARGKKTLPWLLRDLRAGKGAVQRHSEPKLATLGSI